MLELANALKLLGDETRLRILRLIAREPLNVSEVTSILGLAQSGISRHLSLLRNAGLVSEQREGVWTYYQVPASLHLDSGDGGKAGGNGNPEGPLAPVWEFVRGQLSTTEDPFHDVSRLVEVLRQRENFGGGLSAKLLEPGQSWFAWSRALHFLLPEIDAIDLGCGDGTITVEISRFAKRVVGIDSNPRAIKAAWRRAEREHRENVDFREGRIEDLREPAESYHLAVFSQSLHHMEDPASGLHTAHRLLVPGGRLIVVDLAPHTQQWVREKLGHHHLGFSKEEMTGMLEKEKWRDIFLEEVHQRRGESFRVILASALKS